VSVPRLSPAPEQPSEVAGALGADDWAELEFEAFGTWAHLAVRGAGPGLLLDGRERLAELDRRWNPAHPDSTVAALNAAAGHAVPVDDDTYELAERVVNVCRITEGKVGCQGLGLDPLLTRVTVPEGEELDLEGLGWGYAADVVAEGLVEAGAKAAVVDVGGVVRVDGGTHEANGWRTEIRDPSAPGDDMVTVVGLAEGGLATWGPITVLADDAITAVELALSGQGDPALVEASGVPALLVGQGGELTRLGEFRRYERL
jgi:FAD:protein FMN transferase